MKYWIRVCELGHKDTHRDLQIEAKLSRTRGESLGIRYLVQKGAELPTLVPELVESDVGDTCEQGDEGGWISADPCGVLQTLATCVANGN